MSQVKDRFLGSGASRPILLRVGARKLLTRGVLHLVLIGILVVMVFPFYWLLATSLKASGQLFLYPPRIIPNPLDFRNYSDLFSLVPMGTFLFNSFKIASFLVIGVCLSSSLAAFAFARMRFRGSKALFALLLATLMIPGQVTIIPTFLIMHVLGLIDNDAALIVPGWFGTPFAVFLLRQYYRTIPSDLMDSAKIDGSGFLRIYWSIFLPLGMPALATVAVFTFLWSWNGLFGPLIFLNSVRNMTVTLGLTFLFGRNGSMGVGWGIIMAGALLGVVPMVVLFLFAQKYFVQGLAKTGLKG